MITGMWVIIQMCIVHEPWTWPSSVLLCSNRNFKEDADLSRFRCCQNEKGRMSLPWLSITEDKLMLIIDKRKLCIKVQIDYNPNCSLKVEIVSQLVTNSQSASEAPPGWAAFPHRSRPKKLPNDFAPRWRWRCFSDCRKVPPFKFRSGMAWSQTFPFVWTFDFPDDTDNKNDDNDDERQTSSFYLNYLHSLFLPLPLCLVTYSG